MKDKKKKEDRSVPGKLDFDAVIFEGKSLETCMLVLKSTEDPVIIKALSSINNYAVKAVENLQKLYTVGLIEILFPLIQHNDIYVKRFSTKIIAEMCSVEDAKNFLISSGEHVNLFMEMLQKDTDVVVQEFCSLVLAELSTVHAVCATLLDSEIPHVLLIRITSPDPDVQKNSLESPYVRPLSPWYSF
ncbi:armadillo repeat-containing protein 3-like [Schistocerca cancellata]|uniref:armadillo repeat-containing protein 3-like n=1 Tax=Schistocerca cancellata TaxID=274614 RepID=UPI00211985CE|nr:armadillo repeat-containing protein 3-like [Schistocerca cancellata]